MAVIRKNDEHHDVRHLVVWEGKCLHRTAGDDRRRQGTPENIGKHGKQRKTAEDRGGWWGMAEDSGRQRRTVGDSGGQWGTGRTVGDAGGQWKTAVDSGECQENGTTRDGGGQHNIV